MEIRQEMILRKLRAPNGRLEVLARNAAEDKIESKKEELVEILNSHPVSTELMGDGSEDGSSFLNGRSGNLRALIGFEDGTDPVSELQDLLTDNTALSNAPARRQQVGSTVTYHFTVNLPSLDFLYENTPYPDDHTSGSWLRGIEKGIPGLRYYLFSTNPKKLKSFKHSRSGFAIQARKVVRASPGRMTGVKYITAVFEKFKRTFAKQ